VKRAHLAICALPLDAPDRRTSLADLRAALCLETDVVIDDIDPREGWNISRSAYESVRERWQFELADDPDSWWLDRKYLEARAIWLRLRPEWDDDWLAPETPTESDPSMIPLFELETV
jgi:hypothetical protein